VFLKIYSNSQEGQNYYLTIPILDIGYRIFKEKILVPFNYIIPYIFIYVNDNNHHTSIM